jgi:diadenosine tetraphosphate (Ap4A) HIT family hydrolase
MADDACLMCATESTEAARIVFRDADWAAEVVPGYEVPGWFVLRARRHAEGIAALDDHEADGFGRRARDLMTAIGQVTGARTTYLMGFGEKYRHFHVLITARGDDIPADRRGADIVQLRTERSDLDNSLRVAADVRASYERLTARAPA